MSASQVKKGRYQPQRSARKAQPGPLFRELQRKQPGVSAAIKTPDSESGTAAGRVHGHSPRYSIVKPPGSRSRGLEGQAPLAPLEEPIGQLQSNQPPPK